ncbi:hypothetical protein X777_13211, partial [Ooceraea biroi]
MNTKDVQETLQTDARDRLNADANSELRTGDLAISSLCQQCVSDPRQSVLNLLMITKPVLDSVNVSVSGKFDDLR